MKRLIILSNITDTKGNSIMVEECLEARKAGKFAGERFFKTFGKNKQVKFI